MTESQKKPYLSIVVCGRNDNYGEKYRERLSTFIRALAEYGQTHPDLFELIFVEWNPPANNPPIAEAFDWASLPDCRIITVPNELHKTVANSERIPLFEYWAKNVGVRRARGEYVLVMNPDIILSPSLLDLAAQRLLQFDSFYRVDRTDFNPDGVYEPNSDILLECIANSFLLLTRYDIDEHVDRIEIDPSKPINEWPQARPFEGDEVNLGGDMIYAPAVSNEFDTCQLHFNAAGDFIMASKDAWIALEGFWERPNNSHIDSFTVAFMHTLGLKQVILRRPHMIFHMDHSRAEQNKRPTMEYDELKFQVALILEDKMTTPNKPDWGFKDADLPEVHVGTQVGK